MPKTIDWPAEFDQAIRDHYPSGGTDAVMKTCPGFTADQVRGRAKKLGVRVNAATQKRLRRHWGGTYNY